ncbi:DEHA2F18920p [Debaryomyces hansenii CBS767]|uniref:Beta-hexosaminidase n=1 Tax=Debaryomyces hansenii (strain ATCC 36239 / CBS 767 / BCRC 21394 / JCM 1990 / NBRC 0083 / IGC 2968) TaxID=284592 RepID=B5RUJ1_DEBHA|nr:DEHA2F18920p [Debaryomyces hansenii CBS767]CAR66369.1 DEHA2F18920p [Debaryomyces hansenii CBS767]|eukprot:XP_002770848.1 DEHA2F18920p [Debaryomyces hansenii CBS767]
MMTRLIILILISTYTVLAAKVNPLPIPRNITWNGDSAIKFDERMQLNISVENTIIKNAFHRTLNTIRELKWIPAAIEVEYAQNKPTSQTVIDKANVSTVNQVDLVINDYNAPLQLGINETYELKVDDLSPAIVIRSETIWGALHAFSTLQQLIIFDELEQSYYIEGPVYIWDTPIYQHRGLMIDTGRNFLTVKSILEQIDVMSLSKMNSLHWHLEDSQSWPVAISSYPEMTKDAYSNNEIYTPDEIRHIVQYSMERGVRIIPEIDIPGHARAGWRQIDNDIITCGDVSWTYNTAVEPPAGQLDIAYNFTYTVVKKVYDEISSLFKDAVFHIGGDEVNEACYNHSKYVQEWYGRNSSLTIKDLMQHWLDKGLPIFRNHKGRRLTMWEDIVTGNNSAINIPRDVILQCWSNGADSIKKLTNMGYDIIVSSASHLYLDCGYGGFVTNDPRYVDSDHNEEFNQGSGGSWCNPYKTWQRIYSYDFAANLTQEEKQHIIGVEAALWSEQVDSIVVSQKIWPRTAALAELTWSGNKDVETGKLRTNSLTQRLLNFREYLVAIGYNASPLVPKYCMRNPHACDIQSS